MTEVILALNAGSSSLKFSLFAITSGEDDNRGFYVAARSLVPDLKHENPVVITAALKEEWKCTRWKSGNLRGLKFPALNELRALFDRKHGKQDWGEGDEGFVEGWGSQ